MNFIQNIIDQGYDPFDLSDKFYREICTPYNSENGTDVLLDDREEYVYSTIVSENTCPSGCEMSSYSLDTKYITCECDTNDNGIVALDLNNLNSKNALNSFSSTLKNSNYKVMRCYNLVFNFKIFCHNYGSIITLIFFLIYVAFMIYYCCKDITPIKVSISKLLFDEEQKNNNDKNTLKSYKFTAKSEKANKSVKSSKKKKNKKVLNYPPKKIRVKKVNNDNSFDKKKQNKDIKLIDIVKKPKKSLKNKKLNDEEESIKSDKVRKRKSIIDYQAEMVLKTRENLLQLEQEEKEPKINSKNDLMETETTIKSRKEKPIKIKSSKEKEKEKEKNRIKQELYNNYELNHMGYFDASELDKRTCLRTYWSVLLREHYVLFTFISRNDFNLFYVKIERFFIIICTEMTMNGMFFVHETMYKKKTGGLSFAQKLPQIIFSILVTHVIEIILCFLGMTDVHYYEIKALIKMEQKKEKEIKSEKIYKEEKEEKDDKIFNILKKIQRKLTAFYIFTFLLFLFHWYFISAFCAVYQNTQVIYLRDSGIAILTSLVDPFIIYGITSVLRAISLSMCCRKKIVCLYKLSNLIPIF